jgi:hypothetical protein
LLLAAVRRYVVGWVDGTSTRRLGGSLPERPWHSDLDRVRVRRTGWYDACLGVVPVSGCSVREVNNGSSRLEKVEGCNKTTSISNAALLSVHFHSSNPPLHPSPSITLRSHLPFVFCDSLPRPPSSPLALFSHMSAQPQNATVNPACSPAVPTLAMLSVSHSCCLSEHAVWHPACSYTHAPNF